MRVKNLLFMLACCNIILASVYVPAGTTSTGKLYGSMVDIYDYLYGMIRSVCILSGLALTVGGFYQYSMYRKDPVYMPFSKVVVMFVCAFCALGLAYIPGVSFK